MQQLDDTQPSRSYFLQAYETGPKGPPKLLLWGVILLFLLVVFGTVGTVAGFRLVLQPGQQQRVIDQLPFMRMFLQPTPEGGIFPTLVSNSNAEDALALLEMPFEFATATLLPPSAAIVVTSASIDVATATQEVPSSSPGTATDTAAIADSVQATDSPTQSPSVAGRLETPTLSNVPPGSDLPSSARIYGILHQQQTWNNCGPATITMALSYYGWQQDQAVAARALKPNREDKNVSPHELATFVEESSNVKAIVRMGGTLDLLKNLVANGFPVVIETGAMFEAYDWIGHYRALVAYDDVYQLFYFFDSFLGVGGSAQGVIENYGKVDRDWQAFNRTFIVVYEPQREGLLRSIIDSHWTEADAAHYALEMAQQEARREPQQCFCLVQHGNIVSSIGSISRGCNSF